MNDRATTPTSVDDHKFIWTGIGLGAFFWIIESAVHTVILGEGQLFQQIHSPEPHEIWMRLIVVVLFIGFGIYAQFMITRRRQAEEAAIEAYGELNQVFETAVDGMRIIDKDFNVRRVNDTFATLSGVSKEEAVGKKCYEVFHGPLCHTPGCPLALVIAGEERIECEVEKEHRHGRRIPCVLTGTPFRGPAGDVIGIVEDFRDISEQKQAEEALLEGEKRFRELADLLPQPVYEIDRQGKITFLNRRGFELSGYSLEDFEEGLYAVQFFVDDDRDRVRQNMQKILGGEELGGNEYSVLKKNGNRFPVVVHSAPIVRESKLIGIRGVIVDITERKQAENALREAHDALERRVDERTAQLVKANEQLKLEIDERKRTDEALRQSMERTELAYKQAIIYAEELKKQMTERDRAEKELRQYRDHLEEVVEHRTAALRASYEQLQREMTERKKTERALRTSEKELRFLSSQLLTAQERERRRLSIELHDELGQALMVLKLKLRSIEGGLQTDQTKLKGHCHEVISHINEITENVRRLSRDLSPSILEDLGLAAAIQWLVDASTEHCNIESSVDVTDMENLFSEESEIIVYRITQECLTNIAKHAQATHVLVVVKKEDGHLSFRIEDDGKGFDVQEVLDKDAREKGLGLAAMHERARMLGGSLDIWSQEGAGTRITMTIPLNHGGDR